MRKPIAMIATILFLIVWAVAAATIGSAITDWPQLVQLVFYVVAGIGWVFPLKPLMAWMNSEPKPD
ncbi:MAG: DUF2842 domain-containing protein [Pseudomonadota bacterium]